MYTVSIITNHEEFNSSNITRKELAKHLWNFKKAGFKIKMESPICYVSDGIYESHHIYIAGIHGRTATSLKRKWVNDYLTAEKFLEDYPFLSAKDFYKITKLCKGES